MQIVVFTHVRQKILLSNFFYKTSLDRSCLKPLEQMYVKNVNMIQDDQQENEIGSISDKPSQPNILLKEP